MLPTGNVPLTRHADAHRRDSHADVSYHEPVLHQIADSVSISDSRKDTEADAQAGFLSDSVSERIVRPRNGYAFADTDVDSDTDAFSRAVIAE